MSTKPGAGLEDDKFREQFISFFFYQAVRDHKPVWMLEDIRTTETFYWEEDASRRTYSPSEALLYAIVHDHRPYARYLLDHFAAVALAMPGARFSCCPSSAPHLQLAVRYDRRDILELILELVHRLPGLSSYVNRSGCFHVEEGKTPLHLACDLLRTDAVLMLLGSGASPHARDNNDMTPLDLVLGQICRSTVNVDDKQLCLDTLLMFMPELRFHLRDVLRTEAPRWAVVLGEDKFSYLVGKTPAPLFLAAMQRILAQLPPGQFNSSLDKLPIPNALKPFTRTLTPRWRMFQHCEGGTCMDGRHGL